MIAVIDYGAGNLFSVQNALDYLKIPSVLTADPEAIKQADELILPGVGAFPDAMRMLRESGLVSLIYEEAGRKPFLGICLGMQLLFEKSEEFGETTGLGLIPGEILKIPDRGFKIPHMGWNSLRFHHKSPLLTELEENDSVYFVHSYMAQTADNYIAASCDYGVEIPALVQKGQVYGAQFHPEKSGTVGLQILQNFAALSRQK